MHLKESHQKAMERQGSCQKHKVHKSARRINVVDSFESVAAGFVAQMKRPLTNKHDRLATIYVYHNSDLAYVQKTHQTSKH